MQEHRPRARRAAAARVSPARLRTVLAGVALLVALAPAGAAQWRSLGPDGGPVVAMGIGVGPARGILYAATLAAASTGSRLQQSVDNGMSWTAATLPPRCRFLRAITVRGDGIPLVDCDGVAYRSVHGQEPWTRFGVPGLGGDVVTDPAHPQRAVFRARLALDPYTHGFDALYFTTDDGVTWSAAETDVLPYSLAFDPGQPGRVVGLTRPYPDTPGAEFVHESEDGGRTWRFVGTIATGGCDTGRLFIDGARTLYRVGGCGLQRSDDGGVHWISLGFITGNGGSVIGVDPASSGLLVGMTADARLWRSIDKGTSWSLLPAAPGRMAAVTSTAAGGSVWTTTDEGVFVYDATAQAWQARVGGMVARPVMDVAATGSGLLLSRDVVVRQSADDGATWSVVQVEGESLVSLYPHATDPDILLAFTQSWRLVATLDGGLTWSARAPADAGVTPYNAPQRDLVATGAAGLRVYATQWVHNDSGMAGCCWVARDVARSDDGGSTWRSLGVPAGDAVRFFVGVGDVATLFASGNNGTWRSRDGGEHWDRAGSAELWSATLVADPVDTKRWYAVWPGGRIQVSDDVGSTWRDISLPYAVTAKVDLVVDRADTRRLWLVHDDGAVSLSVDGGARWRLAVSPSPRWNLTPQTARARGGLPATIHAGSLQGMVRIVLAEPLEPGPVRAVEYARIGGAFEHYFVTADLGEMARLDLSSAQIPFLRTGLEFDVWPPGTVPHAGASAVCRFYGLPSKGLDSHFFSVSPAECDAVRTKFGDTWIFETADAFVAGVPDAAGVCPAGTSALYRVFNNRRDANHRYTTDRTLRDAMVAKGWLAEGYGADAVAMCVPQ